MGILCIDLCSVLSDLVRPMFVKIVSDMIAFRNPYLVKSVNSEFTHVYFSGLFLFHKSATCHGG